MTGQRAPTHVDSLCWPSVSLTAHARKFSVVRPCGFTVMRADGQTDRQTYSSQYSPSYSLGWRLTRGSGLASEDHKSNDCKRPFSNLPFFHNWRRTFWTGTHKVHVIQCIPNIDNPLREKVLT